MLAVDTNIVVRIITDDDRRQAIRARNLVDRNDVFVATTVFLESEWVLRSSYSFGPEQIADRLAAFAGLPRVKAENPALLATALQWMRSDMDFADALHLAAAEGCDGFVSFDTEFVKAANAVGATKVRRA